MRTSAKNNPQKQLYDRDEHVIVLNEWTKISGHDSYVLQFQNGQNNRPHTILVNGYGSYHGTDKHMPVPIFYVEKVYILCTE